ncbi:DUF2259 domain-containing protein [Methylopila sp. M107]|uniref:DUF2259 domain-containing protein n=1 Tax=Methylopila sp. M107 TaxID=1101190 RepID=UPI00035D502A|nr:DUF2259 domain-containing protein [Methylopila sp. M107]
MRLRCFVAALSIAALGTSARAGDGAGLDVLGYSADGERFAYEQFGSQDGSSFPYSDLFVIDAATGEDVDGGPFRTVIEKELAGVEAARDETARKAKPVLERLAIGRGGMAVAVNEAARPSEELLPMDVYPVQAKDVAELPLPASALGPAKVRIETSPARSPHCDTVAEGRAKALTVTLARGGAQPTTLHADKEPPDARGCATAYGIAGVYLRPRSDDAVALVVIVSAYPVGFEGPDRRFVAVAARVPTGE